MYRSGSWRKLPAGPDRHGYRIIRVSRMIAGGAKSRKLYVHALVLRAFIGPCPDGMECRHKNGDRSDCRLENLEWSTRSDNQMDRVAHGTSNRGEAHGLAKLSSEQVVAIKASLSAGEPVKAIAHRYGVSLGAVYGIKRGDNWSWLCQEQAT